MYFNFSNTPLFPLSQNAINKREQQNAIYYQSFPLFLYNNSPYITPVISPIIIANTHNQSATIHIAFSLHSNHSVVPIITLNLSHNQKLHQATTAAAAKQLKVIPIKNNKFLIFPHFQLRENLTPLLFSLFPSIYQCIIQTAKTHHFP